MQNPQRNCLAIIGARAGSKRLPGKNRAELFGRPLYWWTLEAARRSRAFRHIIFSTDDQAILAGLAGEEGVIAHARPKELANDKVTLLDTIYHLLGEYASLVADCDSAMLLTPCHPFRRAGHISRALASFSAGQYHSLVAVSAFPSPPEITLSLENGLIKRDWSGPLRKAEFVPRYFPNGAMYLFDLDFFRAANDLYGPRSLPFEMAWPQGLDIDEPKDLKLARELAPIYLGET